MDLEPGFVITDPNDKQGKNEWVLLSQLGTGGFGELWLGCFTTGKKIKVAIKFELQNIEHPQLIIEFRFYHEILRKHRNIPHIYHFGPVPNTNYNCIVMQLLGMNLDGLRRECDGRLSVRTVLQVAIKIVNCLEYVHEKRVIHRDIKPENFAFGRKEHNLHSRLYIIDFGCAKEWKDENGNHIPYKEGRMRIGTPIYMSINVHNGITPTRRDDMESAGYLFLKLLLGTLPWERIRIDEDLPTKHRTIILCQEIGEMKKRLTIDQLCTDAPEPFKRFIKTVRDLGFQEKPPYDFFRQIFHDYAKIRDLKFDNIFDWDRKNLDEDDLRIQHETGGNVKMRDVSSSSSSKRG